MRNMTEPETSALIRNGKPMCLCCGWDAGTTKDEDGDPVCSLCLRRKERGELVVKMTDPYNRKQETRDVADDRVQQHSGAGSVPVGG
jgi:hypothetical protein